jgi:hypothetical protein
MNGKLFDILACVFEAVICILAEAAKFYLMLLTNFFNLEVQWIAGVFILVFFHAF